MTLVEDIKHLIIDSLGLEDIGPDDIDADAPLFGEGLGLDSIDALELGLALQKKYNVKIAADDSAAKAHFRSVATIAAFVAAQ